MVAAAGGGEPGAAAGGRAGVPSCGAGVGAPRRPASAAPGATRAAPVGADAPVPAAAAGQQRPATAQPAPRRSGCNQRPSTGAPPVASGAGHGGSGADTPAAHPAQQLAVMQRLLDSSQRQLRALRGAHAAECTRRAELQAALVDALESVQAQARAAAVLVGRRQQRQQQQYQEASCAPGQPGAAAAGAYRTAARPCSAHAGGRRGGAQHAALAQRPGTAVPGVRHGQQLGADGCGAGSSDQQQIDQQQHKAPLPGPQQWQPDEHQQLLWQLAGQERLLRHLLRRCCPELQGAQQAAGGAVVGPTGSDAAADGAPATAAAPAKGEAALGVQPVTVVSEDGTSDGENEALLGDAGDADRAHSGIGNGTAGQVVPTGPAWAGGAQSAVAAAVPAAVARSCTPAGPAGAAVALCLARSPHVPAYRQQYAIPAFPCRRPVSGRSVSPERLYGSGRPVSAQAASRVTSGVTAQGKAAAVAVAHRPSSATAAVLPAGGGDTRPALLRLGGPLMLGAQQPQWPAAAAAGAAHGGGSGGGGAGSRERSSSGQRRGAALGDLQRCARQPWVLDLNALMAGHLGGQ